MGLTDADVTFTNDLAAPLTVQRIRSTAMGQDLPESQSVPAGQTTAMERINTSDWSLEQSSFTLAFNGETVTVELGTGLYKTDATWSGTDGKIGGILAPINFGTDGVDFRFWFFASPGGWPSIINTYLLSIIQTFVKQLSKNPITVPLPGLMNSSVTISGLVLSSLNCSYGSIANLNSTDAAAAAAAVLLTDPIASSGTGRLSATVILNISLKVSGSISLLGGTITSSGSLAVTNASCLVRAIVDLSQPKLAVTVTTLATSVDDWSLSSDIIDALEKAFPPLAAIFPLLTNGYHLAAFFNSQPINGQIISLINKLLRETKGLGSVLLASVIPLPTQPADAETTVEFPISVTAPELATASAVQLDAAPSSSASADTATLAKAGTPVEIDNKTPVRT